jgi:integrase
MNKRETQKLNDYYSKYLETLKLQGYSDSTIEAYTHAIRRIAGYFDRCPDGRLTKDELKTYFFDLLKTHSWSTIKRDRNGLQRYWSHVLELEWDWVLITKPPKIKTLPDILSAKEINLLISEFRKSQYAVFCIAAYTMGLRISEALGLSVSDIDREHNRVHVRLGKGKKDRYVELPDMTYHLLREFWATHRHSKWIFPSQQKSKPDAHMDRGSVQRAVREATKAAGIHKRITSPLCGTAMPLTLLKLACLSLPYSD